MPQISPTYTITYLRYDKINVAFHPSTLILEPNDLF